MTTVIIGCATALIIIYMILHYLESRTEKKSIILAKQYQLRERLSFLEEYIIPSKRAIILKYDDAEELSEILDKLTCEIADYKEEIQNPEVSVADLELIEAGILELTHIVESLSNDTVLSTETTEEIEAC